VHLRAKLKAAKELYERCNDAIDGQAVIDIESQLGHYETLIASLAAKVFDLEAKIIQAD
jgi:hypothetical protein